MPVVSLVLMFGLAVWAAVFMLRGSLLAGCLAAVLAITCFGPHFASFDAGPLTLSLDRVALIGLLAMYAFHRWLGWTEAKPMLAGDWLTLAFVGLLIPSTFSSDWNTSLPKEATPVWRLLSGYLVPLMIYWVARQARKEDRDLDWVHGTFALLGVYLAVTGICEVHRQWWLVFPKHIADPSIGLHFGRARGPMLMAVSYGLCVGIALLAAWVWSRRFELGSRLIFLSSIPLYLAGVYYSYTRSVWMGVVAALGAVAWFSVRGAWRGLLALVVVAGTVAMGAAGLGDRVVNIQREESSGESRGSAYLRLVFAHVSWRMFQDRPIVGAGFGQFPVAKIPYLSERVEGMDLQWIRLLCHHNTFLSLLTETGIAGLSLFVAMMVSWGVHAWRLWSDAGASRAVRGQGLLMLGVLILYMCQLMFHELSYQATDNVLVFFLAGVTMGSRPTSKVITEKVRARSSESRAMLGLSPALTH